MEGTFMVFLTLYQQIKVAITEAEFITRQMQVQNYDLGLRTYRQFIVKFQGIVGELSAKKKELEEHQILLEFSYVLELLKGAVFAQEQKDYILLSDILQIQITSLALSTPTGITKYLSLFYKEEVFQRNLEELERINPELSKLIKTRKQDLFLEESFPNFIWEEANEKKSYLVEASRTGHPILRIEHLKHRRHTIFIAIKILYRKQQNMQPTILMQKRRIIMFWDWDLLIMGLHFWKTAFIQNRCISTSLI
jgi:hypothetical protein